MGFLARESLWRWAQSRPGALAQDTFCDPAGYVCRVAARPCLPASPPQKCTSPVLRCLGVQMTRGLPRRPNAAVNPLDTLHPRPHPGLTPGSLTHLQHTPYLPLVKMRPLKACVHPLNTSFWSAHHQGVGDMAVNRADQGPAHRARKSGGKDSHKVQTGRLGPRFHWRLRADSSEEMPPTESSGKVFPESTHMQRPRGCDALEEAKGLGRVSGREKTGPDENLGLAEASPAASRRGWEQEGHRAASALQEQAVSGEMPSGSGVSELCGKAWAASWRRGPGACRLGGQQGGEAERGGLGQHCAYGPLLSTLLRARLEISTQ